MRVLLFSDSFVTRTMFTKIDNILIDPSVAICPKRYGLEPKEYELRILEELRKKIVDLSKDAKYVVVTHYHWDHVPHPKLDWMYELFKDKEVFLKDFESMHRSGKERGRRVYRKISERTKDIEFADGKEFNKFTFSKPFWHGGEESKVGKVIFFLYKGFLFASDTQGFLDKEALEWVMDANPKTIFFSGYPSYRNPEGIEESLRNVEEIMFRTDVKTMIMDHHATRDKNFRESFRELFEFSEEVGVRLITAAEFMKTKELLLEARRDEEVEGWEEVLEFIKNLHR